MAPEAGGRIRWPVTGARHLLCQADLSIRAIGAPSRRSRVMGRALGVRLDVVAVAVARRVLLARPVNRLLSFTIDKAPRG